MSKKISLILLSNSGSRIKNINISKLSLLSLASLFMICIVALGYGIYDYYRVKVQVAQNVFMNRTITHQADEISQQRGQIQAFAIEINTLKEKLLQLDKFEEKIRIIANLEKENRQDNLFGVGGAAPEDLDPGLSLQDEHNGLMREMHSQINELETASQRQESDFTSLLGVLEGQKNLLASTPAIRPVKGWITSRFGYRSSPFTGRKEFHKGLDIAHRKGTPIVATADGVVAFAGRKGLLGNVIVIDHGHGISTRYGHLQKAIKKRGEKVKRGDIIAQMGSSGRSTGPHLHYEVRLNGVQVNPSKYILN